MINGGGASTPLKCFRYGGLGYPNVEWKSVGQKCFKCMKQGHHIAECKSSVSTSYNYVNLVTLVPSVKN